MQQVLIYNQAFPLRKPLQVDYCDTFLSRLKGLMFRPSIGEFEGILMVQPRADRLDAAIHMFFMSFDITVVWADSEMRVVDVQYARRWQPAYMPAKAARYILEAHAGRLKDYTIGDKLVIEKC